VTTDAPTAVDPMTPPVAVPPVESPPAAEAPAPPPPARRRRRAGWWIGLGTAAIVIAAAVAHQFVSAWLYDLAAPEWAAVADADRAAYDALVTQADRSAPTVVGANELSAVLTPELVPAERIEQLRAATGDLQAGIDRAVAASPSPGFDFTLAPFAPAWERYAAVVQMTALTPERGAAAARLEAEVDRLVAAQRGVGTTIDTVFADVAAAAESQVAAAPSATHRTRLDVRRTVGIWAEDGRPQNAADYTGLLGLLAEVRSSHEAGEARRNDAGQATRLEIEAFARSVSYGVPLDFAWAYEVAGKPSHGWIAGTAEFFPGEYWSDEPGWGHITLSESVETSWGDVNAEALVVHEVGHVQVVREVCAAIFNGPVFGGDHEVWATAWAIGMGYDVPGSGIEAYGRPSAEQIAASTGCR
jgi:hypothetical protein